MKLLAIYLLSLALAGVSHGAPLPATRTLASGDLSVAVMEPNAPDKYYTGVRFSPVATVLRATFQGKEFFFSPEEHDRATENGGLAMEFDLFPTESGPLGFLEAAEGEGFLKIGVGVLKKSGESYMCWIPYELLSPAKTEVAWEADRAIFRQTSEGVRGYAYELDSIVSLAGHKIEVLYRLKNTGTREFTTIHYTHNFFRFDNQPIIPGYEVDFPFDFEARIPKAPNIEQRGRTIAIGREILPKIKAAEAFIIPPEGSDAREFVIRNTQSGLRIRGTVSLQPSAITIHANPHYICPEQFVPITLRPGEQIEWVRTYELYTE